MLAGRILADLGATVDTSATTATSSFDELSFLPKVDAQTYERLLAHWNYGKVSGSAGQRAAVQYHVAIQEDPLVSTPPVPVRVLVSPYGATGRGSQNRATELIVFHASGLGYLTPRAEPGDVPLPAEPPLACGAQLGKSYAALHVASSCIAGVLDWLSTGRIHTIDISQQDVLIPLVRREITNYQYTGKPASRGAATWAVAPAGIRSAKDGFIRITIIEDEQWQRFAPIIGRPEWAEDARFRTGADRLRNVDELEAGLREWLVRTSRQEALDTCQAQGVPVAPANTAKDLYQSAELRADGFVFDIGTGGEGDQRLLGSPLRFNGDRAGRIQVRSAIHHHGQPPSVTGPIELIRENVDRDRSNESRGLLSGIRLLDFGHVWAGPYAAQVLAHAGAEVIKVESARHIDLHRRMAPFPDGQPGVNRAGTWSQQNSGKRSVTLNLASPRGLELAMRLITLSHAGIENYGPGVMDRLGLSWERIHETNPAFVMSSISGFGPIGAFRSYKAYGPTIEAFAGLSSVIGYSEGPPRSMGGQMPDTAAAMYAAIGILAALLQQRTTGEGAYVQVSQLESTLSLIPEILAKWVCGGEDSHPRGNDHEWMTPHNVYQASGDQEWIAIAIENDHQWRGFCDVLNQRGGANQEFIALRLLDRPGRRAARRRLDRLIAVEVSEWDPSKLVGTLQSVGIPASRSMSVRNLLEDAHLNDRRTFASVEHPELGTEVIYTSPWVVDAALRQAPRHAPLLGEGNEYVYGELLGLGSAEISDLQKEGIIY